MRRTHDYVPPTAIAYTVLWIWRHRRCLLLFQVSRCSSWSSSDRMRVVLHTAMSELIWANPGGGRFEPSASRQPLMKSIKLSTFREHCFTKPLKHTMQQTAELGLSACVESERAMLLFRGLKTTLQSRALIFLFIFSDYSNVPKTDKCIFISLRVKKVKILISKTTTTIQKRTKTQATDTKWTLKR